MRRIWKGRIHDAGRGNQNAVPSIEFKDIQGYDATVRSLSSRVCSTYQDEDHILDCMKYTLNTMKRWKCTRLVVRYGETWFSCDTYFNRDDAISALFKDSLSKYITRFDISRGTDNTFMLQIKLHELGNSGLSTNIGPNLLEYIATLF